MWQFFHLYWWCNIFICNTCVVISLRVEDFVYTPHRRSVVSWPILIAYIKLYHLKLFRSLKDACWILMKQKLKQLNVFLFKLCSLMNYKVHQVLVFVSLIFKKSYTCFGTSHKCNLYQSMCSFFTVYLLMK